MWSDSEWEGTVGPCRMISTLSKSGKAALDRIATENGVQVSWLIRRAVTRFSEQTQGRPLLPMDL